MACEMPGNESANYKGIQRFTAAESLKSILLRLSQEEATCMIGDPTELPRPAAKKTAYVGRLSDGHTHGYGLRVLATPYPGRAIPCHLVS
jgi:hypothetical protein